MKKQSNIFRFTLHQNDVLFCEGMFNADQYHPYTRYSVNIKPILPGIINKLQKTLSKKQYDTKYVVGDYIDYDYYDHYKKALKSIPYAQREDYLYEPEVQIQEYGGKTLRGVEFKIGLYINENPIVERTFLVDGFNTTSRWSSDIVEAVQEVLEEIEAKIKRTDVKNIWDDYDLINCYGFSINYIREMPNNERFRFLNKLKK
jgi:hypothetical protein